MPELPEVETIVRDLKKKVRGRKILDVWSDVPRYFNGGKFASFYRNVKNRRIKDIYRKGKNILFLLDNDWLLLVHQKMTGHFLVGRWKRRNNDWFFRGSGPLGERVNTYLHLVFKLDDGRQLALSDLRKFAKVALAKKDDLEKSSHLESVAPDVFELSEREFAERLRSKKGKIKQVLMNQEIISGIGNIYADEILWKVKIHPLTPIQKVGRAKTREIYKTAKEILRQAINCRGTSIDDYRDTAGKLGRYGDIRNVYRREGEKCSRCSAKIQRMKINGRSAHYCPKCQRREL